MSNIPRLGPKLLKCLIREELLEEIQGDLEEQFEEKKIHQSATKAKLNYWYQIFQYAIRPFALKTTQRQSPIYMSLLKHNLTISIRSYTRSMRTFLINLLGLTAGLAAALFIYLWAVDEWKMDRFHANNDQLYRVMASFRYDGGADVEDATPVPLASALVNEIPGISSAVSVQEDWFRKTPGFIKSETGTTKLKASEQYISGPFFDMFSYELLQGNSKQPFPNQSSVLISDALARKLYPNQSPVGEMVAWEQEKTSGRYEISGVFKAPGNHSSKQFDLLFPLEIKSEADSLFSHWYNFPVVTYVTLPDQSSVEGTNAELNKLISRKQTEDIGLFLQPYADQYLFGRFEGENQVGGRIAYVKLFLLIAIFVLGIASINFMNLSTAKATIRNKEVGVKKSMGAKRKTLIAQFLSESFLLALIAWILSNIVVVVLLPYFNQLTGKSLGWLDQPMHLLYFGGIAMVVGLLAGSYPALYLSGFEPIAALRNRVGRSMSETVIRKGLVIFQFSISTILIVAVAIVTNQIHHIEGQHLGFDRENVIQFDFDAPSAQGYQSFLQELRAIPEVINTSGFTHNMTGNYGTTTGLGWEGKSPENQTPFVTLEGGIQYLQTMAIPLKDGDYYSQDNWDSEIILNEAAVKVMGLENAVGQVVDLWGMKKTIVGITENFHFASLHEKVQPCMVLANPFLSKTLVRISSNEVTAALAKIETLFQARNPGVAFEYHFLDQSIDELYQSERQVASLAQAFAFLSIIISCLGLLGLTAFAADRRSKEICIRRVLGSSPRQILIMLSTEFTYLVVIALVVALPIAYFLAFAWLQNFALAIELSPVHFIVPAFLTIAMAWLTISGETFRTLKMNTVDRLRQE